MINIVLFFLLAGVPLLILYRFFFKTDGNPRGMGGQRNQAQGQLFDEADGFHFDGGEEGGIDGVDEEEYAPTRLSRKQQAKMARK